MRATPSRRAFLAGCSGLIVGGCSPGPTPTIYIGHLAPLSGPNAERGVEEGLGADLACEEFNQAYADGVNGFRVGVLHADTGPTPEGFSTQATRVVTVNRVMALVGALTDAELTQMANATLSLSTMAVSAAGVVIPTNNRLVYTLGTPPTVRGSGLARHAADEVKSTAALCLVDTRVSGALSAAEAFRARFVDAGRTCTLETFGRDDDWTKLLTSLPAGPQSLAVAVSPASLRTLRDKLGEGFKSRGVYYLGDANADKLTTATLLEGAWTLVPWTLNTPMESLTKRLQAFRERSKREATHAAMSAYEAVSVLLESARRAQSFIPSRLRDGFVATTPALESLTGPVTFGVDHTARRGYSIARLNATGLTEVQRIND